MRTICFHIFLASVAVTLLLVFSEANNRSNENWQYLVFAQQWPTTACLSQRKHKCQVPSYVSSWTVHGIWPTGRHSYPSFCNKSLTFNVTAIKPIEDELRVVWPNLYSGQPIYTFWKHEWLKHGTCAVTSPLLDTELKYFAEAIREHNMYNILKYLEDDGITPDELTTYSMDHFKTAIESKIRKRANFQCAKVKDYESPLILTVYLCMDKGFALIDCPRKESHCKSSVIYLPLRSTSMQHVYFRPIFYVLIGILLLFTAILSIWIFVSFKAKRKHKMYSVLA